MAKPRGEPLSRELDKRVAPLLATQSLLSACAADSPYRNDGVLVAIADGSLWQYDIDSTLSASGSVLVPDSGSGRWINMVPPGGAGSNQYKTTVKLCTAGALAAYTRVGNTITANANGALGNIDGVAATAGIRILIQSDGTATGADTGIYDIDSIGGASAKWSMTRSSDSDASAEVIPGLLVHVDQGTAYGNRWWFCTTSAPITLNTTALSWELVPSTGQVTSLTTRVSTEESTRSDADASLTTRVSTEESTRSDADASLTTRVSTEESTRSDADASLTTRVSTEESTRSDAVASVDTAYSTADASLTTRVSTEESTRSDADASLTTRVSTEESTRSDADASLTTRVSTEESTRSDAVASLTLRIAVIASATITSDDLTAGGVGPEVENIGAVTSDNAIPLAVRAKLTDAFDNGAGASLTMTIGVNGDNNQFVTAFDCFTGSSLEGAGWVSGTINAAPDLGFPTSSTQFVAEFTAGADTLANFTNGSVTIEIWGIDHA